MKFGNIEIPANLIQSLQENRIIVFAGAGVSMAAPANLPDFVSLTRKILNLDATEKFDSPDQKLGEGFDQGVRIHEQCIRILQQGSPQPTALHDDILKLFPKKPKVITTNFDLLFEQAFKNSQPNSHIKTFNAPVFPLGNNIEGIIYLHGNITDPRSMVLSDADFGRAYLSESWAKRLLNDAFLNYDFIFIGYSYNDTILKYLTRALPKTRASKLYAFTNIEGGNVQQINHWQSLGVEPLIYRKEKGTHQQLPEAVHELSKFMQYDFADQDRLFKVNIKKYEQNNSDDVLNYVKFFLDLDNYKSFYTVANAEIWLPKITEDQTLFDVFMRHEEDFFQWLIGYLETHLNEIMDFLQKYPILKSNQSFLWRVFRKLDDTDNKNCYWKWFLFLERSLYQENNLFNGVHLWVLKKLIDFDLINEFSRALEVYLYINIQPEVKFCIKKYDFYSLIDKVKNKDNFHKIVVKILVQKIEEYDVVSELYNQKNEHTAWTKKEIWEKDKSYSKELNYDLVHGILEIIAEKKLTKGQIDDYAKHLLNSKSILLKRLGLYVLSEVGSYDTDFIYNLINLKIDFFDSEYRSEVFKFLEKHYQKLSAPRKREVIEKINDHFNDDREKIKWFAWIHKFSPLCILVKQEYENVEVKYPNYTLSDKPYLAWHSSGVYSVVDISPFTSEEIEQRHDYIWYLALLEYDFHRMSFNQGNDLGYVGLWQEIIKAKPFWLLDFLDFTLLVTPEHSLIIKIVDTAKNWHFDQLTHDKFYEICQKILSFKDKNQIYAVVHFLSNLNEVEYYQNNIQQYSVCIELAQQIIILNIHTESTISGDIDELTESLNSVNGALVWFVIKLYELSKNESKIQKKCEVFIHFLLENDVNGYALIRILGQYSFLKNRNSLFAQKEVLPYLFSSHEKMKLQSWRGYLQNKNLEYAEFREIHKEFFNILNYALGQNDKELIESLTDLYVYSIYFEYHGDSIVSLRKLQRLENNIVAEQVLETIRIIIVKHSDDLDKIWSWFGEYLQDRIYQVNQVLSQKEVSKIWYLLTDHPQLIVKLEKIILNLPFKEEWTGFLHDISRNHVEIILGNESIWCRVLAYYLNQQDDRITGLCYEEEQVLFIRLLEFDDKNLLKLSLFSKGIVIH